MNISNFISDEIQRYFGQKSEQPEEVASFVEAEKASGELANDDPSRFRTSKPPGRVSIPDYEDQGFATWIADDGWNKPEFLIEQIQIIRALSKKNENMGSVYNDLIQLTNTGHKIQFDNSIDSATQDKMRKHLKQKRKGWGSGVHNIEGLVNKWIGQIWIAGALSNEWVPNKQLTGIINAVLVNPENIRFRYNKELVRYEPYQLIKNNYRAITSGINHVKLNTDTYFYAGILGDTDSPYGIPPFITALESIYDQKIMKSNIRHILKQLGLLGYLEAKINKPQMDGGKESLPAYEARLDALLKQSKENIIKGFAEGVVVGFDEDHEFEFHATTKNLSGVSELYNQNEVGMANGLKTSPSFIGQKSGGTETNMGIVFTKMLSQLKNIQSIVSENLQKGYLLELQFAGYNIGVEQLTVEFKPSTIADELKLWQAKEIKQRVLHALRVDGIIGQDTYAEHMGEDKPFQPEPVVPFKEQDGKAKAADAGEKKGNRNEVKKKSDRKVRDKNKKQPKRKDTNTKAQ